MIENHVNLTIIETGTHILTHVIEYDKNKTKNKTIVGHITLMSRCHIKDWNSSEGNKRIPLNIA